MTTIYSRKCVLVCAVQAAKAEKDKEALLCVLFAILLDLCCVFVAGRPRQQEEAQGSGLKVL